jgi:glycosyltransferase involved in cell wall biosynthesis
MRRPLVYDITRLVTRIFARTPNGIDRVDHALACQALRDPGNAGLILTPFGPRVLSAPAAREALANIRKHWGEDAEADGDRHALAILDALDSASPPAPRLSIPRKGQYAEALAWMRRYGPLPGEPAGRLLAGSGVYLNVSQFPLSLPRAFGWLGDNPRVQGAFFIHDLLPLETPEFFRPAERARHVRRLATLARHGSAAIVSSATTAAALARQMAEMGRPDLPICVMPLPPDPAFTLARERSPPAVAQPYFVLLGTVEPRKNHLLILQVWREIVARLGVAAPKLVLIGERGWENEQVMDLIERCGVLQQHVLLASGLSTPGVRRLLAGARALLAPSFAEGYGLPVVEGLAVGVPVLASDISIFREIAPGRLTLIDPIDGSGWLAAILRLSEPGETPLRANAPDLPDWEGAFERIRVFLEALTDRAASQKAQTNPGVRGRAPSGGH